MYTLSCTRLVARFVIAALLIAAACAQPAPDPAGNDPNWWKTAVIYEIYPRSFADTNGDGIGDLNGITAHLDYLQSLGIDAIWITPFFSSPQVDFGYDISNYRGIDPQYGTMEDCDRLIAEAGKRHIRVIGDFVLNHTSDLHPWFTESRSSRTNPKADWYVWNDGKANRQPPNNWLSIFGHSAWQYDKQRNQFYYHAFYKEQPDLNWHNKQVRDAMYGEMRFWMKRGMAGFRLDAVPSLFEDPQLRDAKVLDGTNEYGDVMVSRDTTDNLPEVHDVLREMRHVSNEFPGRVLIGETYVPNIGDLAKMYGSKNDELQLPMDMQYGMLNTLSADGFRRKLRDAESGLNGNLPLFAFDNHDNRRSWNRYGDGKHDGAIAKLVATLLLAPRAVSLMYYGEELGMSNNDPKTKEDVKDPIGKLGWPKEVGRDGERTPMQWNAGRNAGFSEGSTTWLPVAPNYKTVNVEAESQDSKSILNYYRALIRLRKENAAMRNGSLKLIDEQNHNVLSFLRTGGGKTVLVSVNFTADPQTVRFEKGLKPLLSSFDGAGDGKGTLELPPFGSYIGEVR